MGEHNLSVQQEINQNLSTVSRGFQANNEELAYLENNRQGWANSRVLRKKPGKFEQQRHTQDWVNNSTGGENNLHISVNSDNLNVVGRNAAQNKIELSNNASKPKPNNHASADEVDTINRENLRNSKESLKKNSCENILTIEENMRASKKNNSNQNIAVNESNNIIKENKKNSRENILITNIDTVTVDTVKGSLESVKSVNDDYNTRKRSSAGTDAYGDAIDLSNNCRQFYFNHMKAADAIKQSVRTSKHKRAREKMEGKESSSIDNAMERLRAEMADLMEQDLSLMSQLLKLNDKIEEVKHHVRQRSDSIGSSYMGSSTNEISDSEFSDFDESKLDISGDFRPRTFTAILTSSKPKPEPNEVVLRKIVPSERDIIVYKKKSPKRKQKRRKSSSTKGTDEESTDTNEDDGGTADDESDTSEHETGSGSHSDTESTISCNSCSTTKSSSYNANNNPENSDTVDSGIQSPTPTAKPAVPPKPRKGGVSRNTNFMNFHKQTNGTFGGTMTGLNSVLTLQGHNISVDKYYVPQGLVYLKHTKSDNVFCQFSH